MTLSPGWMVVPALSTRCIALDDVTWADARDACEAAGARLCTSAEWLLACGGADGQAFPYGNSFRSQLCNGQGFDADAAMDGNQDHAVTCGSIQSCELDGVYDMSGNLKEWTADTIGNLRAVRGGVCHGACGWDDLPARQ